MSLEEALMPVVGSVVGGTQNVHWDTMPDGVVIPSGGVVAILQRVGGEDRWYVNNALPSHEHARIQITIYTNRAMAANGYAREMRKAIAESGLIAEPIGSFQGTHDHDLSLYSRILQFGFWHPVPA